jgi:hypothetical protein
VSAKDLPLIGWREWIALPELGVPAIKAKVDTGARSSALHAFALETFRRRGREWVRFEVHPIQRSERAARTVEALVVDHRKVRSSGGHEQVRPVILTEIELLGGRWPIELTLTRRDVMGFRMLLGRQAVRGRFLVHPGRSWYNGKPPKSLRLGRG